MEERGSRTAAASEVVYILDDDKWIRYHMTMLLQAAGYATKSFASGEEFFAQEAPAGASALLLDVNLEGRLDGLAVQSRLASLGWTLPIIFITAYATVPMTVKALKAGAEDLLIKPIEAEVLLPAVERAMARAREMQQKQHQQLESKDLIGRLTEREREVLSWVIAGTLNKQTAAMMGISERTVKAHRASIMEKLEVASLAELIRIADKAGVAPRSK